MLDGLKNKLGLGGQDAYDDRYADEYDEYAQDYDEYDDYYDDRPAQGYDRYDTVTTRTAGSNRSRRSSYTDQASTSLNERRAGKAHPPLVNIDDVKNSTRVPDSLNRDPLPPRRRSNAGRATALRASDYKRSGAEIDRGLGVAEPTSAEGRRNGYGSLFEPSADAAEPADPTPASSVGQGTHPARGGYDPYQAYEGAGSPRHAPTRRITVISPTAYSEVEAVSRGLKAGDAMVLNLRNTGNQLSKRVLDFSFGVASALDASVDCIADQVFAITRTAPLSDQEIADLRTKGVM